MLSRLYFFLLIYKIINKLDLSKFKIKFIRICLILQKGSPTLAGKGYTIINFKKKGSPTLDGKGYTINYYFNHTCKDCDREIRRIEMARIARERRYYFRQVHPEFLSSVSNSTIC